MADLISIDRARSQIPAASACDDALIAAVISACSETVEAYCNRTFLKATYDEVHHGTGTPYLFLDNPPISRVAAVRTGLMPALYVQYADPASQTQYANVEVTATGVTLTRMYNGTPFTNTFAFADYPVVSALGTAINGLAGWTATIPQQFSKWATNDLYVPTADTGTFNARNATVPLTVYWTGLSSFRVNPEVGELYTPGGFVPGYQNYRVIYDGGFAEVPQGVQQAVAELVQMVIASRNANPLMQSETLDKYSYSRAATAGLDQLSAASKMALNQHKLHRVARYK